MPKVQLKYKGKTPASEVKSCFKAIESKLTSFKLPTKQFACSQDQREIAGGRSEGSINIASLIDLKLSSSQIAELQKVVDRYVK